MMHIMPMIITKTYGNRSPIGSLNIMAPPRTTERERQRESVKVDFREIKENGFAETRRDSKAFTGGTRGERDRDRGETR